MRRQTEIPPPVLQAISLPQCLGIFAARALARPAVVRFDHTGGRGQRRGHLATVNLGLKTIPVDRRRHRDRDTRLLAMTQDFAAAAEIGLKEHDRLALAQKMMERMLEGRRTSSKLPQLIELVMARPLVSAGMVAKTLEVTPAGGAADCQRARVAGDDGEGEVSGAGVL